MVRIHNVQEAQEPRVDRRGFCIYNDDMKKSRIKETRGNPPRVSPALGRPWQPEDRVHREEWKPTVDCFGCKGAPSGKCCECLRKLIEELRSGKG